MTLASGVTDELGAAVQSFGQEQRQRQPAGARSVTEEDAMHPVLIEAIAAERARESQAHAEAAGLARQFRRARRRPSAPPASSARPGLWRLPRPLRHA
jgi:hypothetical protein